MESTMAGKDIYFGEEARNELLSGINQLARVVGKTHGPKGRAVLLEKSFGGPTVSLDGATIAKEIEVEDRRENLGIHLIREVAKKQADAAGDGTTTSIILSQSIFSESLRNVAAGTDAMSIKRGIDHGVRVAIDAMKGIASDVEGRGDLTKVATLSANGDKAIGNIIGEALHKAGVSGAISVEEGQGLETTLEFVEGMQFDKGYLSPHFITDFASMETVLENCYIVLHEKKISAAKDLVGVLELCAEQNKPLLVVAEDIEGEALQLLVVNKIRGVVSCCGVKAPGFGDRRREMLQDMAILTGGEVITETAGMSLETAGADVLGRAKRVAVGKDDTTISRGAGKKEDIAGRLDQIRKLLDASTSDYDKEKLQERISKLSGGIATIQIGGSTESEVKEKKERAEDAVAATRAAAEEGVVPGGGIAYLRAAAAVADAKIKGAGEKVGLEILTRALAAPTNQIVSNAGRDGEVITEQLKEADTNQGFDAANGQVVDMLESGIVDPLKVTRLAVENAASIASLLVSTQAVICKTPEKEDEHEDHMD